MLPKQKRLTTKEFTGIFKKSRTLSSPFATLRYTIHPALRFYKCSFVVSKKIARKAVERNRLRRLGYHALQGLDKNIKPNTTCIFFLKKAGATLSREEFSHEVKKLLTQARLLV